MLDDDAGFGEFVEDAFGSGGRDFEFLGDAEGLEAAFSGKDVGDLLADFVEIWGPGFLGGASGDAV